LGALHVGSEAAIKFEDSHQIDDRFALIQFAVIGMRGEIVQDRRGVNAPFGAEEGLGPSVAVPSAAAVADFPNRLVGTEATARVPMSPQSRRGHRALGTFRRRRGNTNRLVQISNERLICLTENRAIMSEFSCVRALRVRGRTARSLSCPISADIL
jgi:hypothetical protein